MRRIDIHARGRGNRGGDNRLDCAVVRPKSPFWPPNAVPKGWRALAVIGGIIWSVAGCDDPPQADPLEALEAADLTHVEELAGRAEARSAEGIQAAIELGALAGRLGRADAVVHARGRLAAAAEWRELAHCEALAAWQALEGESTAADEVAFRAFAYGCVEEAPARRPEPEAIARIERDAARCIISRVRAVGAGGDDRRVILDMAGGLRGRCAFDVEEGGLRLVVRFPSLLRTEDVPAALPIGSGVLRRISFADNALTISLDGERVHSTVATFEDPQRLVIDLSRPGRADIDDAPVVVLDPGHGGAETGARYEELTESALVLDLAQRTAEIMGILAPSVRVLLTRDADVVLPLEERAARANSLGADLFVSIHLNAANEPVHRGGVTTFVLDTSSDEQAVRLAARENGTRTYEVSGLQRLLAGFHRRSQMRASRRLAEAVHAHTLEAGRTYLPALPDRGVKSAMFYVLVGARMPAILLEASFLTKREEAEALRTEVYRQRLSEGIADGILAYLQAQDEQEEDVEETGDGDIAPVEAAMPREAGRAPAHAREAP